MGYAILFQYKHNLDEKWKQINKYWLVNKILKINMKIKTILSNYLVIIITKLDRPKKKYIL